MPRSQAFRRNGHSLCPAMKPACSWGCCTAPLSLPGEYVAEGAIGAPLCIAQSATRSQGLAGVRVTVSAAMHPCCPCVGTPHTPPAQTLLLQGAKSIPWVGAGHGGQFLLECREPTNSFHATQARAVGDSRASHILSK